MFANDALFSLSCTCTWACVCAGVFRCLKGIAHFDFIAVAEGDADGCFIPILLDVSG